MRAHRLPACPPSPLPSPNLLPARRRARRARPAGFTLIELLVVLAVLVVVLSVAMPAMGEFSANNRLASLRSGFATTLALARTEAVKRGLPVLVQAQGSGPAGNEYAAGWELVVDADSNGLAGSGELRLHRGAALPTGVTLAGPTPLVFRAAGTLVGNSDQRFDVCRASGSRRGYSITVTPSGGTDVAAVETCP